MVAGTERYVEVAPRGSYGSMVDVSPRRLWILRFGALFAWQGLRRLRSWRHAVGSAGLPLKRRLSDLSKGSWVRPCALGLSNGWSPQNGLPDRLDGSSVGPWALELVGRPHVCGLCCRGVCSYGCSDRRVCCSLDLCVCGNLLAGVTRGDPCQGSLSCSAWTRAGGRDELGVRGAAEVLGGPPGGGSPAGA